MKLRDKSNGVIVEVNREAFVERGQDFDGYINQMKKDGFEVLKINE